MIITDGNGEHLPVDEQREYMINVLGMNPDFVATILEVEHGNGQGDLFDYSKLTDDELALIENDNDNDDNEENE